MDFRHSFGNTRRKLRGAPRFLRENDFDTLYIVGDLIDIWSLRRMRYWPQQHNDVIQKILRKARKGTRVVYIPGNHDELVADFCGLYGNIQICRSAIHVTVTGKRILVIHGHELDTVVQNARWLAFAGDLGYQFLLSLNPLINFVRRWFGLGFWSLSAYAKRRVKDAVSFIGKFEAAVAHYARRNHADAVLCGHIHSTAIREFGNITYYNCGDWGRKLHRDCGRRRGQPLDPQLSSPSTSICDRRTRKSRDCVRRFLQTVCERSWQNACLVW